MPCLGEFLYVLTSMYDAICIPVAAEKKKAKRHSFTQHLTRQYFITEAEKLTSGIRFSEEYQKQEKHINMKDIYTFSDGCQRSKYLFLSLLKEADSRLVTFTIYNRKDSFFYSLLNLPKVRSVD